MLTFFKEHQIVCDKDGVVDWWIVLTPLKPQQSNPNHNPLANQLWCIDFFSKFKT